MRQEAMCEVLSAVCFAVCARRRVFLWSEGAVVTERQAGQLAIKHGKACDCIWDSTYLLVAVGRPDDASRFASVFDTRAVIADGKLILPG